MIPLSKTLDLADFDELAPELKHVDPAFGLALPQHPMRRWEYALALHAFRQWGVQGSAGAGDPYCYDVGGAGSPFSLMLPCSVRIIDPRVPSGYLLEQYVAEHPRLGSCVFCISVLEHIADLDRFCYHLSCLTAPGGLLFLTVDYCDGPTLVPGGTVADHYDLHHMRERIFNPYTLGKLTYGFLEHDFSLLGPADFSWHGAHVGPPEQPETCYTFASLALIKRP